MAVAATLAAEPRRCPIVDDEPSMRAVLRRLMQADGFECIEAASGDEAVSVLSATDALSMVRSHHERFDGHGIPDQLHGTEIPLVARMTAVADSFDAMIRGRSYRVGLSVQEALAELQHCAGSPCDPACVEAFARALDRRAFPRPGQRIRRATMYAIA
jgi:response regulator RpfG family c-di-GMP phosphodiesterase